MERAPRAVRVACPNCKGTGACGVDGEIPCAYPGCDNGYFDAILVPLAGGPVVVEKGAWRDAVQALANMVRAKNKRNQGFFSSVAEQDEAFAAADIQIRAVLGWIFPAGIVVAAEVGVGTLQTASCGDEDGKTHVAVDIGPGKKLDLGRLGSHVHIALLRQEKS